MGGVDRGDQLRGCRRKFYKYIYYFLFDVAITNSYILHKNFTSNATIRNIKQFRLQLAKERHTAQGKVQAVHVDFHALSLCSTFLSEYARNHPQNDASVEGVGTAHRSFTRGTTAPGCVKSVGCGSATMATTKLTVFTYGTSPYDLYL